MALHTAPRPPAPSRPPSRRSMLAWAAGGVVGVLVAIVVALGVAGPSPAPAPAAQLPAAAATPAAAPAADPEPIPAGLPLSTTYTTIGGAPRDTAATATDGIVVHPVHESVIYDSAGGRAIARIQPAQFGDVWLPVIGQQPGWVRVLLPSKPNGSTGWLRAGDTTAARTPYTIAVHLESKRLDLRRGNDMVGSWTVGTGKASAPTPAVRTFVLGAFRDPKQKYSPVILPLGAHSPTLDSFGGGPGTVAIHTWPTDDVFGAASSDGCIRVPSDALDHLTGVPLGTVVLITDD
ncbi:L,D-transpeptidase [Pseudonocardia sp. GCM10023141]|uniref:L,D-transpeptidase n=1 Tax=Pseudonocardia sp. GCM10023141 TaxID=3252653 RepID=UPI0036187C15